MQTARVITDTMFRRLTILAFAVMLAVIVCCTQSRADVVTYSSSKTTYKVGVLLIDSTTVSGQEARGPENPDPYVFYIADQSTDVKPAGWELDNPLAPATVTTDIYNRWVARDPGHPYVVGQKVTKDMAAYWEVYLSQASESDLEQYDLLFITNHRNVKMTAIEREKLRKVVDAGAVVWIEDCGGMHVDPSGRFFLEDLQFHAGGTGVSASTGPVIYQPTHPILNTPYPLTYTEIANLGDKNYGGYYLYTENADGSGESNLAPNRDVLTTVIGNKAATDSATGLALPYIAAGVYGSGAVIATAGDSGCDINDYAGGTNAGSGGNSGAYCGENIKTAHTADLKFVYNIVAWGGANGAYRRNNRRTASSLAGASSPLNKTFDFSTAGTPATAVVKSNASPLISQGILYVTGVDSAGRATLRAYDTVPNRDYDGDGNIDDGVQDLNTGLPYDMIWSWTGGAVASGSFPSSPVLATVTIGGESGDMILFTLPNGTLYAFNARPLDPATKRLLPTNAPAYTNSPTVGNKTYDTVTNGVAPSPVFFNNKIYVVEPQGALVRCVDANGFVTRWRSTNATAYVSGTNAYRPTATPTLGLTRLVVNMTRDSNRPSTENTIASNTSESTNDIMLYVPVFSPVGAQQNGVGTTAGGVILPFWLGTRNEGTKDLISNGSDSLMRFRPASTNADQYFISKGGNGFITPSVKLYADVTVGGVLYTREENFAAGRSVYPIMDSFFGGGASPYTVTWQNSSTNANFYSGSVVVTKNGAAAVPGTDKLLAVADYDVVYVPLGNPAGTPPTYLAAGNGQSGSRNSAPLAILNYAGGLDTAALAPNDLLIYGANQVVTNSGSIFGSVTAMQEREFSLSASRMRWRYLFHEGGSNTISNTTVTDLPTLRNRLTFVDGKLDSANLMTTAPYYEGLTGVQVYGSPIVANEGVTYVLAKATSGNNGNVSVLMAFRTAPSIVLDLGEPIQSGSTVTVSQYDYLTGSVVSTNGDANDRTRVDADFRTGKVTIGDFGALNNGSNLFSASSSFVVTYVPAVSSGTTSSNGAQTVKVLPPFATLPTVTSSTDVSGVLNTAANSEGGFSPLLWYYVLPGTPESSPVRVGDAVYFTILPNGGTNARIVALDADPTANDSTVHVGSGEQVYNVVNKLLYPTTSGSVTKSVDVNHVRWESADLALGNAFGAPVASEGVLAVNSAGGTSAFSEGITLLADNTRIMEVNADGAAVWSNDGTVDHRTSGGAAPVFNADGSLATPTTTRGRETFNLRAFRAPQTVRRLGSSDYLVADTGNNRVVRFDRGGNLLWSVERLQDPYGVLAPGDPLTLNNPTDVLVRTLSTYDASNNVTGFETHYIIADSGNYRVIDVVDYFDRNGTPGQKGVVVWTTRTASREGRKLAYHNIQLTAGQDTANTSLYGKPVLVASVGNLAVAAANNNVPNDSVGGSLVQLDYNPYNTGFVLVTAAGAFNQVKYYWGGPASVTEPTTNGRVSLAINDLRIIASDGTVTIKKINAPTYFELIPRVLDTVAGADNTFLIADADAVYYCVLNTTAIAGKQVFDVIWMFRQSDYDAMNTTRMYTPILPIGNSLPRLAPASVKRLANGNYLITNSATGPSAIFDSGQFLGEVFEVTPPAFLMTNKVVNQTVVGGTYGNFSAPRLIPGSAPTALTPSRVLNKQQMGRDANGATLTEQPRTADRL